MDILYLCREGKNTELVYSLRTLKNIKHDRVFIAGGLPAKINKEKITYIPVPQNINKWKNSTNNLIEACKDSRLSEDFILMNDDFFILKPVTLEDLHVNRGPVEQVYKHYFEKYGNNEYTKGMMQTSKFLSKMGYSDILSYELHLPIVLNKKRVLDMFLLEGVRDIHVLHKRTLYGNLHLKGTKKTGDCKLTGVFIHRNYDKFLSTLDTNFEIVREWLDSKFPQKSIYET